MKYGKWAFFFVLLVVWVLPVHAEAFLRIKGESKTPTGGTITMTWQVKEVNNRYQFYLGNRMKAEMILENGKVVKIRRRVRFAGKEKWITFKDKLPIRFELQSGFYPFSAVLNYTRKGSKKTILSNGKFEIIRSRSK